MEGSAGDEVDWSSEDRSELIRKVLDLPTEAGTGSQLVQDVDIAGRLSVTAAHGPEDLEAPNPVATADLRKPLVTRIEVVDVHRC